MQELKKYKDDFEDLVNVTHKTLLGEKINSSKKHLTYLNDELKKIKAKRLNDFVICKEDIRQELYLLWIKYLKLYGLNNPKVHVRTYLIKRSIWGIRDWFKKEMRVISFLPITPDAEMETEFELDLRFLVYGTKFFPLNELSSYERYLIFLKYKEEKSILQMSEILQKNRRTIKKQINETIDKLRSYVNE